MFSDDSLKLAGVEFGIYVNMTCSNNGTDLHNPCSKVGPGWGRFNGNQSNGLDPDVTMAGVARHADRFFSHDLFYKQAADGTLPAFSWIAPPVSPRGQFSFSCGACNYLKLHRHCCCAQHEAADHPCMDLAKGERLLKDIYEALRGGKGW